MTNSFNARATLRVGPRDVTIYRLDALRRKACSSPASPTPSASCSKTCCAPRTACPLPRRRPRARQLQPGETPNREIAFTPARVLLQDFTGVPCVVDLAAMREAMAKLGGDPNKINPLQPVELVIDHSVQVDAFGSNDAIPTQRRSGVRAQSRAI